MSLVGSGEPLKLMGRMLFIAKATVTRIVEKPRFVKPFLLMVRLVFGWGLVGACWRLLVGVWVGSWWVGVWLVGWFVFVLVVGCCSFDWLLASLVG
jgi:hypothetical protein